MSNYIVQGNQVHFRQAFPRDVLSGLFVTLYALGLMIYDTENKRYPHMVTITESEFLSCLEMAKGA